MIPEWVWIVWLLITLGIFAGLEGIALANGHDGDTLSERTRRWLGITPHNPRRRIAVPAFAAVLTGFVLWFLPHILWSIW